MKAVILAAGIGSRLRPMTNSKPKCLVKTAGKEILQYQLDAFKAAGIRDVCIVVGYEKQAVFDFCKHDKYFNFHIVENNTYEDTNNMYSLYLAREWLEGSEFILNNADVAIDSAIIENLVLDSRENLIAVDASVFNSENMKVSVSDAGFIANISKDIAEYHSAGCSIDFYKFSASAGRILINEVVAIVEEEKNLKDWTEVSMQRLFQSGDLNFEIFDVGNLAWAEIDNYEDLAASDILFSRYEEWRDQIKCLYVDLDGTIYLGDEPIDGAVERLNKLSQSKSIYFISNNSSKSKCEVVDKLKRMGFFANEEQIILSFDAVISFLLERQVSKIFVLGTKSLSSVFVKNGFEIDEKNPEYVIVGYDTEITYQKLATASLLINKGVDYLATHPDQFCPTSEGPIPDVGAIIKMLEITTGKSPKEVFGKPSIKMIDFHMAQHKLPKEACLLIGDRLHTDIEMASNYGIKSALVLSGETSRDMLEDSMLEPSLIINSIASI